MEENKNPSNPRMQNLDGTYAFEARIEDYVSLRDHFAGLAMKTILDHKYPDGQQCYDLSPNNGLSSYYLLGDEAPKEAISQAKENQLNQALYIAELSYLMADAMLKQR